MHRTARLLFCTLAIAGVTAAPARAQSLGAALGGMLRGSAPSSQMKLVCLDQRYATNYAAYLMGYHVFDTGGGERVSVEKDNALAQAVVDRATISDWSFKGWNGSGTEGRCTMSFAMNLAPEDAAHFDNDPLWGGDVDVALVNDAGNWKITSYEDGGAKAMVSGWLAAWSKERDARPGGAPRLASAPSLQRLQIKLGYARSCASRWEVSDDLFPAYNAWLDTLNYPDLSHFKVAAQGRLEAGRLISSTGTEIVCRYNISTGGLGGANLDLAIRDIDMRLTVVDGRPTWAVSTFPNAAITAYSAAQVEQLISLTESQKSLCGGFALDSIVIGC